MIFVDSNIAMYLVGPDHPNRDSARLSLRRLATERERLVTNAEVYQEVLHRHGPAHVGDRAQPTFDLLDSLVDEVFSIGLDDVVTAKDLLATHTSLSARDALHVATMRREGVRRILTFDTGFDAVAGIERFPRR